MLLKKKTVPDLSENSPRHLAAIESGDKHFFSWQYNVEDRFKGKTREEIKQVLVETSHPFAVCTENIIGDFNFATLVRNANVFNAKEVFYIGNKKWDRRGACGSYFYKDVQWLSTIEEFISLKERYTIIGVDNTPGSVSLSSYQLPANSLLVFGEESCGLSPMIKSLCQDIIHIDQYGSIRSLNVGVASGIIMHEFVSRLKK